MLAGLRLVQKMVRGAVYPENELLLERPSRNILCELFVAGLDAPTSQVSNPHDILRQDTHFEISFVMNLFENSSTPPAHIARDPSRVWKPVTTPSALPAHKPSPPFSAASTSVSAAESAVESAAKPPAGAPRMGNRSGLFPNAWGTPENQMGAVCGVRMGCGGTGMGMVVTLVLRSGKCETSGVPGGGRMRENSAAKEVKGDCVGERAMRRLVLEESSVIRDWG